MFGGSKEFEISTNTCFHGSHHITLTKLCHSNIHPPNYPPCPDTSHRPRIWILLRILPTASQTTPPRKRIDSRFGLSDFPCQGRFQPSRPGLRVAQHGSSERFLVFAFRVFLSGVDLVSSWRLPWQEFVFSCSKSPSWACHFASWRPVSASPPVPS